MTPYAAYVLCTSPRSGSTLLCKLLAATGVAGAPGSHFHRPSLKDWCDDYDLGHAFPTEADARAAVFRAAIAKGKGATDLFGLRLQRHSFDFFTQQLALRHPDAAGDKSRIEAAFGPTLFIHLTRTDKVDQAVSYLKAKQTGLWHAAPDGREIERLSPPQDPVYDARAIEDQYHIMTGYDRAWEDWFAAQHIAPERLTYDALAADPKAALTDILCALGFNATAAEGITPATAKLADATSQAWATRFRTETGLT